MRPVAAKPRCRGSSHESIAATVAATSGRFVHFAAASSSQIKAENEIFLMVNGWLF
jgi:hypothetical protein